MIGAGFAAQLSPTARRWLVTVCAMTATIMQALDSTVANVSLPYMQGSLSASLDQINWVLTSYIVAAAIMTAPMAWMADRYGRKRVFIVSATGFTVASLLCAMSQDITSIVLARLLQGAFGAALVPLSQAVMLDAYPAEQRGHAMGIWGMGVMIGPIVGPTIGGFLTENYSWHWVFLINLPVGIVTVLGLILFMEETKRQVHLRFDWFGFAALSVGIGALQMMLDRGEHAGWFGATEIIAWLIVAIAGFYYFLAHSLTTDEPFVRFEVFKDTNFLAGCLFQVVVGVGLFGTMALITPFTQHVLGYPIITAGYVLGLARHRHPDRDDRRRAAAQVFRGPHARLRRADAARGHALCDDRLHHQHVHDDDRRDRHHPGHGYRADLRLAQHGFVCHVTQPLAHQRRCAAHVDPQSRLGDRHLHRDRVAHQQDHGDARATGRAHHPVQ